MQVLTKEQHTEEWHKLRSVMPTASRFGDIMARTPTPRKAYATELAIARVTGRVKDTFTSPAMQRGTELEALARLEYMMRTKNSVRECGLVKHDTLNAGASPDGLIGTDGGLEIKVPLAHNHFEAMATGKVPSKYIWQVHGAMLITDRKWWDFVSYSDEMPENAGLVIIRVERDDEMLAALEMELEAFELEVQKIEQFIREYGK